MAENASDKSDGDPITLSTLFAKRQSDKINYLSHCCTPDTLKKVVAEVLKVGRWDVLDSIDIDIFRKQKVSVFDFLPKDQLNEESKKQLQRLLNKKVLQSCSDDELCSVFPRLVELELWESIKVLLQHVVSKTIDTWVSSPTVRFSRSVLWRIAHSNSRKNVDPAVFAQLTTITSGLEDFPLPKLFRHIDPSLCVGLCMSLLRIVVSICFTANSVNADHADAVEANAPPSPIPNDRESLANITDSDVYDLEVKISFIEQTFFDDKMSELCHDLQSETDSEVFYVKFAELHVYCVSKMENPSSPNLSSGISQLLFVKRFIRMCFSRKDLTDKERGFMFKVMCSMPFLLHVQNTCLQFLLHVKNLNLVLLFDKTSMEEETRRQVFKLAMEEKRWDVVKKWADQTLPDDQRQWALAEARKLKLVGVVRALDRSEADNTRGCDDMMEIERLPDWKAANWRTLDPDETDGWTSLHLACFDNRFEDVDKFVDCDQTNHADPASSAQDTAQAESTQEAAADSKEQSESTSTEQVNDENPSTSDNAKAASKAEPKPESDKGTAQPTPGPSGINLGSGNHNGVGENTQQAESQPQTPKPFVMIKYEYRASVINSQTEDGETPLFVASKEGHVEVVRKLLRYKDHIDVNLPDNQGRTPLLIAYENGHLDVVGELVLFGADADLPNKEGKTPRTLADERGDTDVQRMLRQTRKKEQLAKQRVRTEPRRQETQQEGKGFFNRVISSVRRGHMPRGRSSLWPGLFSRKRSRRPAGRGSHFKQDDPESSI